jgi:hypothetical protein
LATAGKSHRFGPFTPEGKRRRREWLFAHSLYLHQLKLSEVER